MRENMTPISKHTQTEGCSWQKNKWAKTYRECAQDAKQDFYVEHRGFYLLSSSVFHSVFLVLSW